MIITIIIYNKLSIFLMDPNNSNVPQPKKRDILFGSMFNNSANNNDTNRVRKRDILAQKLFGTSLPETSPTPEQIHKEQMELQAKRGAEERERQHREQIKLQAKHEAEEKFHREQIDKFMLIEQEKLEEQERKLRLEHMENEIEEQFVIFLSTFKANLENDPSKCCICTEEDATTAALPCGHMFFCHECINDYRRDYPNRGCPICREKINSVHKIYSS